MKVEVESERYICHVIADYHQGVSSCCSECGDRDVSWYGGTGRIIRKNTEESVTFNFQTEHLYEHGRWTLREAIIGFPDQDRVAQYRITLLQGAYPKILDYSLERLFEQALASEDDIPTCYITKINEHELIKRGWMVGKGGEIKMGLDS